jgi:hypothetical protein
LGTLGDGVPSIITSVYLLYSFFAPYAAVTFTRNSMKKQIKRLSPHQNGKVFGILMAVSSLIFFTPMFLALSFSMPHVDQYGNPVDFPKFTLLIMPLLYLIFGYLFVAVSCLIYNFFVKYIGGIEFVLEDKSE